MNTNQAHPTLAVPPLYDRVAAAFERMYAALQALVESLARSHRARSAERRALDGIAHLNEHVLKDIGAPHWLVANAAERREVRHLQWNGADFL